MKDQKANWKEGLVVLLALVALAVVIHVSGKERRQKRTVPPVSSRESQIVQLNAGCSFDGSRFTIHNKDSYDWRNAQMTVNPGTLAGGWTLKTDRIPALGASVFLARDFTKNSGERFNPYTHKPTKLRLSADTPKGWGHCTLAW